MSWFRKARPDAVHPGGDLLLEDSSFILLEDGVSTILLEA
jgi:hypothetical protein